MNGDEPAGEPHDDSIYDRQVDQVENALRRRVFRVARWVVLIGMFALAVAMVVDATLGAASLPIFATELAALGLSAYLLQPRFSHRTKGRTLVGLMVLLSAVTLGHFGPTLGTGIFFLIAVLVASLFLSKRGVIVTFVLLMLVMVGVIVGSDNGLLAPRTLDPDLGTWVRIAVATALPLAGVAFVYGHIRDRMRVLIIGELQARQREQEAQAARERALQALEASQRLEALGRLAGGVAHDVNNALSVIQGGVGYLDTTSDEQERAQVLDEVRQGVARAAATVSQLLVFVRHKADTSASTEPGRQLEKVARSFARLMPANIELVARAAVTAHIGLSPASFEQVILNLVLNARDAMPDGGRIELRCFAGDEQVVVVEVADEGSGIPPEIAARAFEPFFTTKGATGTGLGLSMVRGAIDKAGGRIELDSASGRGTVVRMRFPGVRAPSPPPSEERNAAAAADAATREGGRILLLEDEVDVALMMERILSRAGFEVDSVRTTAEALDRIGSEDYRVFITDGQVLDGLVTPAIEAFRGRWRDGPIILCSGAVENADVVAGQAHDSIRALSKPFAADKLVATVNEALAAATGGRAGS